MKYRKRILDELLEINMEAFGATWIRGPKGCGQTTTAKQIAKTVVEFQDEEKRDNLLMIANTAPSKLILRHYSGYQKPLHGSLAAIEIGLPTIRQECPLFDAWLKKLEALPPIEPTGAN